MAIELWAGYRWGLYRAIFGRNTYFGRLAERKKTKNICSIGRCGRDRGGWRRPGRRERRRRGVAVLEAAMVRNKSKTNCAPLSMVLFYRHSNLFCTAWEFAPSARVPRVPGEGRPEGSQAEGLAGLYPPLHSYGWDDKSV